MDNKEITRTLTMEEKGLDDKPDFYKSIPANPSVGRLRDIAVRARLPFIVEFIEDVAYSTVMNHKFKTHFKKKPLVVGLIETQGVTFLGTGARVVRPLFPDNNYLTVTLDGIRVGNPNFDAISIGDKYKLKVYNLDYFEE
ncbi:MAG: hypothetical protein ACP5NS_05040 [Candidatus Pacearchaeota archaeon]